MMKKILAAAVLVLACATSALGQSSPGLYQGFVPTPAQWNSYFAAKQDLLGFTPLNKAGDAMLGRLTTPAPTGSLAGFNIGPGSTPSSPTNGDVWMTTAGLFYRYNGLTVGPIGPGAPIGTANGIPYYATSSSLASTTAGSADSVFMGGAPPAFSALTNCASAVTYLTGSHAWGCNASAVNGPASSTNTALARFNGTGGTTLQNSQITADGSGNIGGVASVQGVTTAGVAIQGTSTNSSAAAGYVGEFLTASRAAGSALSLGGSPGLMTSVSLTAGDWDVSGACVFVPSGGTISQQVCYVGASATLPTAPSMGISAMDVQNSAHTDTQPTGPLRVSLATTTTYGLYSLGAFTGAPTTYGIISARRVR